MKKQFINLLLLSGLILCSTAHAQLSTCSPKYASNWAFGYGFGLQFTSAVIPVSNNLRQINTSEGCTTVSDNCGNLLFYSEGVNVWDATNTPMPGVTAAGGLGGHISSTQSAMAVPFPGHNNQYYLFTTYASDQSASLTPFEYSLIDMTLPGNGTVGSPLGDLVNTVSNPAKVVVQDATGNTEFSEKLTATAVRDASGNPTGDYWVIVHTQLGQGYVVYMLTSAGLGAPTNYLVGYSISYPFDEDRGQLKVSPDGNWLVNANNGTGHGSGIAEFEVYQFNSVTGAITSPSAYAIPLPNTIPGTSTSISHLSPYGVEFSPNSTLVYLSELGPPNGYLYQYDLNNYGTSLPAQYVSGTSAPSTYNLYHYGALQLGPDNRIYMAMDRDLNISVINNPNSPVALCGFVTDGVPLTSSVSGLTASNAHTLGLPTLVESDITGNSLKPVIVVTDSCMNIGTSFSVASLSSCSSLATTYLWSFGDGSYSTLPAPTHVYTSPGPYTVTVNVSNICQDVTINTVVNIVNCCTPPTVSFTLNGDSLNNDTICYGVPIVLVTTTTGAYVQFYIDNGLGGTSGLEPTPYGVSYDTLPPVVATTGTHILCVVAYASNPDSAGYVPCSDTFCMTFTIIGCGCEATQGTNFLATSSIDGLTYTLYDSFTAIEPNFINWTVDDSLYGQTGGGDSFSHTFSPGLHIVCMQTATILTGPNGNNICCYNTVCDTIYIDACTYWKATDTITYTLDSLNIDSVTFTFQGSTSPLWPTIVWDFGDGSPQVVSTSFTVGHLYPATYVERRKGKVCVTATVIWSRGDTSAAFDSSGVCCCIDTIQFCFVITPCTLPQFSIVMLDSTDGNYEFGIVNTVPSYVTITGYNWSSTDGNTSGYPWFIDNPPYTGSWTICNDPVYYTVIYDGKPYECQTTVCVTDMLNVPDGMSKFTLYPNPSKDMVMVKITNNTDERSAKIEVCDMTGQPVMKTIINTPGKGISQNYLNIGSLPQGIYTVKMNLGGIQQVSKLVKE